MVFSDNNISNIVRTPEGFAIRTEKLLGEKEYKETSNLNYSGSPVKISKHANQRFIDIKPEDSFYLGYTVITLDGFAKPAIELNSVLSEKEEMIVDSSTCRYKLQMVHKYPTIKQKLKEYQYDILDRNTGDIIELKKDKAEDFFKNPSWDGVTKSERLISGKNSHVEGMTEYYYSVSDSWHIRVDESVPFVVDATKKPGVSEGLENLATRLINYYKQNTYTLLEVYARTVVLHGEKTLKVYKYTLQDDATGALDYFTQQEVYNLLDNGGSGAYKYATDRITNLDVLFENDRYTLRPHKDNVTWHIDEIDTNTEGLYICKKVYLVEVNSTKSSVKKPVEFEMIKLNQDEVEQLKSGELTKSELNTFDTIMMGLEALLVEAEKPLADGSPFYTNKRIDNLKVVNKDNCNIYTKYADIVLYSEKEIENTLSKILPDTEVVDYQKWIKNNEDIAERIRESVLKEEQNLGMTEISWDEIKKVSMDMTNISIKGIELPEFSSLMLSSPVRISTLLDDDTYPLYFDILYIKAGYFLLKEKFVGDSLRTGLVQKVRLVGENTSKGEELSIDYLKFISLVIQKLGREAVLVLGKNDDNKYLIAFRKELNAESLLGDRLIYVPIEYQSTFKVKAVSDSVQSAEQILQEYLDIPKNHPEKVDLVSDSVTLLKDEYNKSSSDGTLFNKPELKEGNFWNPSIACKVTKTNTSVTVDKAIKSKANTYTADATVTYKGYLVLKAEDDVDYEVSHLSNLDKVMQKYVAGSVNIANLVLVDGVEGVEESDTLSLTEQDKEGALDFWNGLGGKVVDFDAAVTEYFDDLKDANKAQEVEVNEEDEGGVEVLDNQAEALEDNDTPDTKETDAAVQEAVEADITNTTDTTDNTTDITDNVNTGEVFKNNALRGSLDVNVDRVLGSTKYTTRTLFDVGADGSKYSEFRERLKKCKKGFVNSIFSNPFSFLVKDGDGLTYENSYSDAFDVIIRCLINKDTSLKNVKFELKGIAGKQISDVAKVLRQLSFKFLDDLMVEDSVKEAVPDMLELLTDNPEIVELYNSNIPTDSTFKMSLDDIRSFFENIATDKVKEIEKLFESNYLNTFGFKHIEDGIEYDIESFSFVYNAFKPSIVVNKGSLTANDIPVINAYLNLLYRFVKESLDKIYTDSYGGINGSTFNFDGKATITVREGSLIEAENNNYNPIAVDNYANKVFAILKNPSVRKYKDLILREENWTPSACYVLFANTEGSEDKKISKVTSINGIPAAFNVDITAKDIHIYIDVDTVKILASRTFIAEWIDFDVKIAKCLNDLLTDSQDINWDALDSVQEEGSAEINMNTKENTIMLKKAIELYSFKSNLIQTLYYFSI